MVQSFKRTKGISTLSYEKEFFNTKVAVVRIKSEHCIGILKSRFPCMKQINIWIKHGNKEGKEIVRLVGACAVLHNILLQCNDEIPQTWYNKIAKEIEWNINDSDYSTDNEDEDDNNSCYNEIDSIDVNMRDPNFKRIVSNYI